MKTLRQGWPGIVFATMLAGCSRGPAPAFPKWVSTTQAHPGNATFEVYKRAALEAETTGSKYLDRVTFTPDQRKSLQKSIQGSVALIRQQAGRNVEFEFAPRPPFAPAPWQKGWRLIGRSLVWDIQSSGDDLDRAITVAIQASSFGFGLTSGGATDASLGLTIADESRKALVPKLSQMSADQLDRLASGIQASLAVKPTLQASIENEREQMMRAVQTIQDAYRRDDYAELKEKLGGDTKDALTYLQDMHSDDARKRPVYFEKLAGEATAEADWLDKACLMPAVKRVPDSDEKSKDQRPWRKFSKLFFRTCRPLLSMNDSTLARTRLLILNCRIMAISKRTGSAPKELGIFPARLRQDPYSGLPFVYRSDGSDYHLYSVGADFKDDGGQTDETFSTPDLMLEEPMR